MNRIGLIILYELKLILRNWLFILYVIISVVIIGVVQVCIQDERLPYSLRALSCAIPFTSAYIFNYIQSVFAIFFTIDFIRRTEHADSLDSIEIRPYMNIEYLTGKMIAIVVMGIGVNILVVLATMLFHVNIPSPEFTLFPYVFYLVTLNVPTLLFWVGISFFMVHVVRIPFLALFILLGYLLLNTFILSNVAYGSIDVWSTDVPNVFSSLTGHVGPGLYLLQRFSFVVLAGGMLLGSVIFQKRLTDRERCFRKLLGVAIGAVVLEGMLGYGYYSHYEEMNQKRKDYLVQYEKNRPEQNIEIKSQDIVFKQEGDQIMVVDDLILENNCSRKIEKIGLFLNPGLQVEQIKTEDRVIDFVREKQVLVLKECFLPHEVKCIRISYIGEIDESICYLDLGDKIHTNPLDNQAIMSHGRHAAFVSDRFTWLTPECLWYPVRIPPVDPLLPNQSERDFTSFRLSVICDTTLTVISQGVRIRNKDTVCFTNMQALSGLTLCMGEYRQRSLDDGRIRYNLYYFSENGALYKQFNGSKDGVRAGLEESMGYFEYNQGIDYPFDELSMIELPVSCCLQIRNGGTILQPEFVFQMENLCDRNTYYSLEDRVKWFRGFDSNRSTTEIESEMVSAFLKESFDLKEYKNVGISLRNILSGRYLASEEQENPFSIAPMFTNFSGYIFSEKYPCVDKIIISLLRRESNVTFDLNQIGVSHEDQAILTLGSQSLQELLFNKESTPFLETIIYLKSHYLKNLLLSFFTEEELDIFLREFKEQNTFQRIDIDDFINEFDRRFSFDIRGVIDKLYHDRQLPQFHIQNIAQWSEGENAVVEFDVWNSSAVEGVISLYARKNDIGSQTEKVGCRVIAGGECSRMYVPIPYKTEEIIVHTNLSANIPQVYSRQFWTRLEPLPSHVEREPLDTSCFLASAKEYIVDDESAGFRVVEEKSRRLFMHALSLDKDTVKYGSSIDFLLKKSPGWVASVFSGAYGNPVRSFHGKTAGKGNSWVEWETELPEAGEYEVFVYQTDLNKRFQFNADLYSYYYTLEQGDLNVVDIVVDVNQRDERKIRTKENDGSENEIVYSMYQKPNDWVPVGTYYLEKGKVKMKLYDRGAFPGQLIFADAVKWVKK